MTRPLGFRNAWTLSDYKRRTGKSVRIVVDPERESELIADCKARRVIE